MPDPSAGSGSAVSEPSDRQWRTEGRVESAERRSRIATSTLALLSGTTAWLSAGTLAVVSGDAERVAALPSVVFLILAILVAVVAANLARLHLSEAWPLAISFLIWLPFIPGRIPNAFLPWQGPIAGIAW